MNYLKDTKWPYMPKDIKGINYNIIDNIANLYNNIVVIESYLEKTNIVTLTSVDIITNVDTNVDTSVAIITSVDTKGVDTTNTETENIKFDRLEPPFNICCFYSNDGCVKKAAFKHNLNRNYYCWFHINCI